MITCTHCDWHSTTEYDFDEMETHHQDTGHRIFTTGTTIYHLEQ